MWAAILYSLGPVMAAVITVAFGKKTYDIVKGNGHGDVAQMLERMDEKNEAHFARIDDHLGHQDAAVAELKGRVDTWEKADFVPHPRDRH